MPATQAVPTNVYLTMVTILGLFFFLEIFVIFSGLLIFELGFFLGLFLFSGPSCFFIHESFQSTHPEGLFVSREGLVRVIHHDPPAIIEVVALEVVEGANSDSKLPRVITAPLAFRSFSHPFSALSTPAFAFLLTLLVWTANARQRSVAVPWLEAQSVNPLPLKGSTENSSSKIS